MIICVSVSLIGYWFQVHQQSVCGCVCVYHLSFNAFKLFSNFTDLIGDVRWICTFRSLCDESNLELSAEFAKIFRKYLLSVRCCVDSVDGGHSPLIVISRFGDVNWTATRPSVGVVWILLLAILSHAFCEFCSNKNFLPITLLDSDRFGDFDERDDDDDDVDTLDAVDIRCDVESSSSLRLLIE